MVFVSAFAPISVTILGPLFHLPCHFLPWYITALSFVTWVWQYVNNMTPMSHGCYSDASLALMGVAILCLCLTAICSAGEQYNSSSTSCEPCPLGTWSTGNDTQRFEQCVTCPDGFVTVNETMGATSIDNCTLSNHSFLFCLYGNNSWVVVMSKILCYIIVVPNCVCVHVCVCACVCMIIVSVIVKRSGLLCCVENGRYTNLFYY